MINTALIYLPITAALGVALYAMGSRSWVACVAICLGLALMTQIEHARYFGLTSLVIWAAVTAGLTFGTPAPWLACILCLGSALTYLFAMIGGSELATVWAANVCGVGMLLALLGGGIIEYVGRGAVSDSGGLGRLALAALRERALASMAPP